MELTRQRSSEAFAIAQTLGRLLTQSGQSIFDLSAESSVLLVFLRHAGCTFCREALSDLAARRQKIESKGIRIVLVHMGDSEALDEQLLKYGLTDMDRICDPGQDLYQAFGLKKGSLLQLFGPKVLWRAITGGALVRHGIGLARADSSQMPAVFLIDKAAIVRRFRHRSAADRPDYLAFCAGNSTQANA